MLVAGRRTPDVLPASASRHWLSRRASPPESCSPAPADGRSLTSGRVSSPDRLDPRPDSHPPTDRRGLPAPEAGATPRTPLAWVRRAACLLLLALTASLPLAGTVQAQSDTPDPVTELTATPGNAQVALRWDASEGAVGYRIRYHAVGYASIPPFPVDVTNTRHTFRNLMNNVEYVFEVSAMNDDGWESDPETVHAIPVEDGVEATPPSQIGYVLLQAGDGQITASWAEAADNGGLSVIDYLVEYRAGGGSWQTWPHGSAATTTTITGLQGDVSYAVRVSAINAAGTGPASAPEYATPEQPPEPTAPSQVTGLRLTAGDAQITASWNAPPDGGSPLTGYRVEYQAGSGSWQQWTHTGTGRNATLTGLTNNTSYGVRVSAINAIGTGPASAVRRATPTAPSQPSVPGKPVVTLTPGDTQIEVEWTEPANNGAAITDYDVRYRAGTSGNWTDKPHTGTTRNTTITSLTNGQLYQVQVQAKNSAGSGPWSDVATATPQPSVSVPDKPDAPTLTAGNTQIEVEWTAPANNGAAITDYDVEYRQGTSGNYTDWPHTGTTLNTTITGLTNDQAYQVRVRATNSAGSGPWSDPATATPTTSPSAPDKPVVTLTPGNAEIEVEWTEPDNNGAAITDYDVQYRQGNSGGWTDKPHTGTTRSTTIESLTNGQSYQVQVRATNSAGTGAWSDAATATPRTVPGKPDVTLTAGNNQIEVEWTAPANNGAAITDYDVEYRQGTSGNFTNWPHTGTARTATITGLTNDQSYQVRVRATNAAGSGAWSNLKEATPGSKSLVFSKTSHTVLEKGGTATWTVALSAQPSADVTVAVTSGNTSDATVNPASLTFTSSNWETAQDVTVTGVDDTSQNTDNKRDVTITHTASSDDDDYYQTATVAVAVADDETETVADAIWSTVMVSGSSSTQTSYGYSSAVSVGALSSDQITHGGSTYTVNSVAWNSQSDITTPNTLLLSLNSLARLPQRLEPLRLRIDESNYNLPWNNASNYRLTGVTSNPFPEDAIREIHLIDPTPKNVAVAAGNAKLTVTWTNASGAASHSVRHRVSSPAGSWTTATNKASGYEITSLTNNTEYDVQVGAVFGSDTYWSDTMKATPQAGISLYSGDLTAGTNGDRTGYRNIGSTNNFGSLDPSSFNYPDNGTSNTIASIFHDSGDSYLIVQLGSDGTARLPEAAETGLKLHVGATAYDLSWVSNQYRATGVSSSPLTSGTSYTVKLTTEYRPAPAGFTATPGNTQVTLTWTGPDNVTITKWQYRQKPASSSESGYSAWTDISGGAGARSHTVTGLTNGTEYTFQIRALNSGGDSAASDEVAVTPNPAVSLYSGTLVSDGLTGYVEGGDGSLTPNNFSYPTGTNNVIHEVQYLENPVGTPGFIKVSFDASTRLPVSAEQGLKLHIGSTAHDLTWNSGNYYETPTISSRPFSDGTSYSVKLTTAYRPPPENFTATAGNTQVTLAWTGPSHADITKWQYRQKTTGNYGNWTDISGGATARSHTVTGLTNNTEYTFQIRALFGSVNGPVSEEETAVPDVPSSGGVFWQTRMTAGVEVIGGNDWVGYDRDGSDNYGSMIDNTFSWDDVEYTWTTVQVGPTSVCVRTSPAITVTILESLVLTIDETDHRGNWRAGTLGDTCFYHNTGLSLTNNQVVNLRLAGPDHGGPSYPRGFTAKNAGGDSGGKVVLAWTGPTDNTITKWQYRSKTSSGYGAWTDMSGSTATTRSHTVTGLTNDTKYTFQIRGFDTKGGLPSNEQSTTPGPPKTLYSGTMVSEGLTGYERDINGSLSPEFFQYRGTTYTIYQVTYTEPNFPNPGFILFSFVDLNRLEDEENGLKLHIDSNTYDLTWNAGRDAYQTPTIPSRPFADGQSYSIKLETLYRGASSGSVGSGSLAAPTGVTAEGGDGAATVTWQMPEAAGIASAPRGNAAGGGGTLAQPGQSGPPTAAGPGAGGPAGSGGPADSGGPAANGSASSSASAASAAGTAAVAAVSKAAVGEYEVAWTLAGEDWNAGNALRVTDLTATIPELANGARYSFRVRAWNGTEPGPWSETVATVPGTTATLVEPFPDLELANGAVHAIDMTAHFSGTGLGYGVMVTTTDPDTGETRTGPINTVARDKVRGSWSGDVLTLTAGPSGHHVLGMEVMATDVAGGTASDDFQLTVGSEVESLAAEALRNALARSARSMLEDASSVVGGRMQSGGPGTDALGAFAGLFGVGRSVGGCPLEESLDECMKRDASGRDAPLFGAPDGSGDAFGPLAFDWSREDEGIRTIDLSEFRERVKAQGFALSLNQPFAPASSADGTDDGTQAPPDAPVPGGAVALTFWGQGSATSGVTDTVFWGLDASMGERWMTGLAFAESGAEVSQSLTRGDASVSGFAESEIAAVYPYIRSRFDSGLEVWSLMGWGSGQVDSTWTGVSLGLEETVHLDGDVAFDLGLVGAEQTLFERDGFSLSALGDAGWSRLAVTSGTAEGIEATVSRTRLGVEGRYGSEDGAFSSSLRAGARVDGGDGQAASGVELMGDVRRTWGRWLAGVEGRWYAADTAEAAHGFQGVKATLGLYPREDGTGLGLTLSPGWGTQAEASKQDGLLAADGFQSALDRGSTGQEPAAHLDSRVSWGMKLPGQGLYAPGERLSTYAELSVVEEGAGHLQTGLALETRLPGAGLLAGPLTPHVDFRLDHGGARHLRAGLAFEGPVTLTLTADRQETASTPATHAIMLRLDTRF